MAPPSRRPARRPFSAAGRPRGSPAAGPSHPARWWAGGGGWTAHSAPGKDRPPHVRETAVHAVGPPPRTAGRRKALAGQGRRGARRAEAAGPGTRRRSHGGLWPRRSDMRRDKMWPARSTVGIGRAPPLRETTGLAVRPSRQHRLPVTGRRGARPSRGRRGPRRAEAAGAGTRRRPHGRSATPFGQESPHQVSSACSRRDWPFIYVERRD